MKLATEAPVNGGRNYDGPKVNLCVTLNTLALVKFGYLLETLSILRYSPGPAPGSKNATGADNQQERPIARLRSQHWNPQRLYAEHSRQRMKR